MNNLIKTFGKRLEMMPGGTYCLSFIPQTIMNGVVFYDARGLGARNFSAMILVMLYMPTQVFNNHFFFFEQRFEFKIINKSKNEEKQKKNRQNKENRFPFRNR